MGHGTPDLPGQDKRPWGEPAHARATFIGRPMGAPARHSLRRHRPLPGGRNELSSKPRERNRTADMSSSSLLRHRSARSTGPPMHRAIEPPTASGSRSGAFHSKMDLRHLRAFLAVGEELHFGKAARRLHIAQPAVSQLIRALEAEFGVVLFERTSRRVVLTPAGHVLLAEGRACWRATNRSANGWRASAPLRPARSDSEQCPPYRPISFPTCSPSGAGNSPTSKSWRGRSPPG